MCTQNKTYIIELLTFSLSSTKLAVKIPKNMDGNNMFTSVSLTHLTDNERIVFFILYLIIFSLSMIANIATLFTTYHRKIRSMQKILIISLALSDIEVCVFFGVNNMINFSHPMVDWILGDFMCSFIPYMQTMGSVANSVTMVSIAFDRYRNIVHPLNKQWDPNIWVCVLILLAIWGFSAGVSYPMFNFTTLTPVIVFITDPNDPTTAIAADPLMLAMCSTQDKDNHRVYYTIIFFLIFLPLMLIFLWLYYKIAELIWTRRKPLKVKINKNNTSVTMETSTDSKTSLKQSPVSVQIQKTVKSNQSSKLHMERKIRTFKIILVIMLVFFVCRMPHFIFSLVKYHNTLEERHHWVIANALSCLLIFNTTLNPVLYSFLNQTIMYFDKFFISIGEFISNICCCCCTNTEFDDFTKDNPFAPENYDPRPSQTSSIIPRGPYLECINTKPNHVKFHDIAVINLYPKETSSQNLNNCNTF